MGPPSAGRSNSIERWVVIRAQQGPRENHSLLRIAAAMEHPSRARCPHVLGERLERESMCDRVAAAGRVEQFGAGASGTGEVVQGSRGVGAGYAVLGRWRERCRRRRHGRATDILEASAPNISSEPHPTGPCRRRRKRKAGVDPARSLM